jgi:flagellar hook-basal body complex protein FliE
MNISQLQRVQQATPGPERQLPTPQFDDQDDTPSFTKTLANAIDSVDSAQKLADQNIESFVAGETEDLHEVMISMNQAKLHFQLMTEVRNRSLETYQELMRMQV